jgi:hypothetical protein
MEPDRLMSVSAEIELQWADGTYSFALKMRQIEELESLCEMGLGEIFDRLLTERWYFKHIYHCIRLALIGGGAVPVKARQLCDMYVDGCPLARNEDPSSPLRTAIAIMGAVFSGIEKKRDTPDPKVTAATMGGSTSRPSEPDFSKTELIPVPSTA